MKRVFLKMASLAAVSMMFLGFTGCGGGFMGVNLTKEDAGELIVGKWDKFVDPDAVVFEITLGTTADFSKTMNVSTITYLAPGAEEVTNYSATITGNQEPRKGITSISLRNLTVSDGVKFSELDLSLVPIYVNEAIALLTEEELQCDGISSYRVKLTGDPAVMKHSFALQSKIDSEMTTKNGKLATQTNYYEFDFEGDGQGNLVYKE